MPDSEPTTIAEELERFLRTGHSDPHRAVWPGSFMERERRAHDDLRGALVREVLHRAEGRRHQPLPSGDHVALTRAKVEPMVRGLFQGAEQAVVLAALEKSVVFLTTENIESLLLNCDHEGSAWQLANLYLTSVGAELLGDATKLVGLSEETTCFVSPEYFTENDPFANFIVHEAAHIFHNCKRATVGLEETRRKEWLLDIDYYKRETFAYSCEAYSCVLAQANSVARRRELAAEYGRTARISEERVDVAEVSDIVAEAAAVRNGWKVILARCAPVKRPRPAVISAEVGVRVKD